jgi:hypothetical protein
MQPFDWRGTEGQIDQCVGSVRGKTMPPIGLTQPIADLQAFAVAMRVDATTTHKDTGFSLGDCVNAIAHLAFSHALDKVDGILTRVWMRHASEHARDAKIVGKIGNGIYVFDMRRAQNQPFGDQDGAI